MPRTWRTKLTSAQKIMFLMNVNKDLKINIFKKKLDEAIVNKQDDLVDHYFSQWRMRKSEMHEAYINSIIQ